MTILSFKMSAKECILALLISLLCVNVQASEQDDLNNLRKRISALQQEFEKTRESKSEASDALRKSERTISTNKRKLHQLARQQNKAKLSLRKLQGQAKQLNKDMQDEQAILGKLLYQQYLGGNQEYLKLILSNHNPNQVARELLYYDYIARSRAAWLKTMRENLLKVQAVSLKMSEKSHEVGELQKQQLSQRKLLNNEKKIRLKTLHKIAKQLKSQRREMGRLQRNENRLSKLVERLTEVLSQPKFRNQSAKNKLPNRRFDRKPFAKLKGRLALPVSGRVINRFGDTHLASKLKWKGLFMRARAGQYVKSVAAGRVIFADWLRGFGNLLIIDHGKGYMSLYGYNESLLKQVGDVLHGGDNIATVGNSGGNAKSGLYFELRHKGIPLNPMKWIAR